MTGSKLQPALLGGILMGVLSALPFVSLGNCCCCLWVVSGGLLAAYLLQQSQPAAIEMGDGAGVGLLAGVIGAVAATVLSVPINLTMGPMQQRILERVVENVPNMPAEMRDAFQNAQARGVGAMASAFSFVVMLVAGMVFSTVGGIIGTVIFRRGKPAASEGAAPPA